MLLGTEHRFRQDLNSTGLLSKIINWKGTYRATKLGDRSDSRFQGQGALTSGAREFRRRDQEIHYNASHVKLKSKGKCIFLFRHNFILFVFPVPQSISLSSYFFLPPSISAKFCK